MIYLLVLLGPALATEAVVVPEATTQPVEGPAVVLTPSGYRRYVSDSRQLPACLERERAALDALIETQGRVLRMRDIVYAELDTGDDADVWYLAALQQAAEREAKLTRQRDRARGHRAVLGLVVASVAAGAVVAVAL